MEWDEGRRAPNVSSQIESDLFIFAAKKTGEICPFGDTSMWQGPLMKVIVKKWGNRAAVRIPAPVLAAAALSLDQAVDARERKADGS